MPDAGSALMGIGSARGEDRAIAAAEMAVSSPLLEASIDGAHGVLLSISGGSDLGLFEINEAAALVAEAAHPEANIIFGAVIDDALGDEVRVTVIAAGFDGGDAEATRVPSRLASHAVQQQSGADQAAASALAAQAARPGGPPRRRDAPRSAAEQPRGDAAPVDPLRRRETTSTSPTSSSKDNPPLTPPPSPTGASGRPSPTRTAGSALRPSTR